MTCFVDSVNNERLTMLTTNDRQNEGETSSIQSQMRTISTSDSLNITGGFKCSLCEKIFQTQRGRTSHFNYCRKKHVASMVSSSESATISEDVEQPNGARSSVWGLHNKEEVQQIINAIYEEVVFWRRNLFMLPTGKAGKKYIMETTRLINIWNAESVEMKDIALKAVMIMPALLLQKPSFKSKSKHHGECLERRLILWESGDFDALVKECTAIQSRLQANSKQRSPEHVSQTLAKLMLNGKVNAAMRLLDNTSSSGILQLSDETM